MKLSIRTVLLLAFTFFLHFTLFARTFSAKPFSALPASLYNSVRKVDDHMKHPKHSTYSNSVVKICSCQIMNLQSNNYNNRDIAVFAERSSKGDLPSDIGIAKKTIEKEKKHMKMLFYDKLIVVDRISEATDCRSLYVKLKMKNNLLVIYDILDADGSK
jgi:hypothetical protein